MTNDLDMTCRRCGYFGLHVCDDTTDVSRATVSHTVESASTPTAVPVVEMQASARETPDVTPRHLAQVILSQQNATAHIWEALQTLTRTVMEQEQRIGQMQAALTQLYAEIRKGPA